MHPVPPRPDEANSPDFSPSPASLASEGVTAREGALDVLPVPVRKRGWPLLSWLVILALVGFVLYRNHERLKPTGKGDVAAAWLVGMQSQGRYLVGWAHLMEALTTSSGGNAAGAQKNRQEMYRSAQMLDKGSYSQRLRFATLAGELSGPAEAGKALARLESERQEGTIEARPISVRAARLLERLYRGYQKKGARVCVLDDREQQFLRSGLGWFGELALAPAGSDPLVREQVLAPAIRTAVTYFGVGIAFLIGFLAGFVLLLLAIIFTVTGKMGSALSCGTGHGGVYAETFALYMLAYFGISLLLRLALSNEALRTLLAPYDMLLSAGAMFLSLAVLGWPVLRGIAWQQVRADLGLSLGPRPRLNTLFGPLTYLCALPVLVLGIIIMYALMLGLKRFGLGTDPFEPGAGPSHPIVNVALQKDWWVWLQVFLVASVAAPIVEEIMFRGVLYRHLREASHTWGRRWSILASVLASGFVFAVIHPQGWLGVPVLMGLATVFALAREWRGSLVPAMIAHGLNNGFALLILLLVAG